LTFRHHWKGAANDKGRIRANICWFEGWGGVGFLVGFGWVWWGWWWGGGGGWGLFCVQVGLWEGGCCEKKLVQTTEREEQEGSIGG